MLEQILAGDTVALMRPWWIAFGPASLLGAIGLVAIAIPILRQPHGRKLSGPVTRVQESVALRPLMPGLVLLGLAAFAAYLGARPAITLGAEGMNCQGWPRSITWAETRSVAPAAGNFRPELAIGFNGQVEVPRESFGVTVARLYNTAVSGTVSFAPGGADCPVGGLLVAPIEVSALTRIAMLRARMGALPDPNDAAAVTRFCADRGAACADNLRAGLERCRAGATPAEVLACRYGMIAAPGAPPRAAPVAPVPQPAPQPVPQPAPQSPPRPAPPIAK